MKYYKIILFTFLWMVSCSKDSDDVQALDRETVLKQMSEMVILPFHQNFKKECQELHVTAESFQNNPSESQFFEVQNQWKQTQLAWKKCEVFEFGEAKTQFMHNKIGKWETNVSFLRKNLNGTEILDENFVSSSGSTSKGLPAIEYLIFGEDILTSFSDERKRQYLTGMTADLLAQATKLAQIWQDDVVNFQTKTQNGVSGSLNMLVNSQVTLLEEITNSKLGKPLGKDNGGTPNPEDAEAFRSGFSGEIIKANLEGIQASFFGDSEQVGLQELIEMKNYQKDGVLLSEKIKNQFDVCFLELQNLDKPLSKMVVSEPQKVESVYLKIRELLVLFKVDLASALSITVTFNDNDGD